MGVLSFPVLWLGGLLIFWAVLLFGSYCFPRAADSGHAGPRWALLASSAVLTVAAWSTVLLIGGTDLRPIALLIAAGMTFGFLGDLFMAGVFPAANRLIAGMGSFGVGHIFYIAAGILWGGHDGLTAPLPRYGGWLAWLLIAALAWYAFIYRGQKVSALHWIVLPYALLLASTAGVATGLALQAQRFLPFAIGGALFLSSDFLIALREFTDRHTRWMKGAVWLTYGPAQALIVYTLWFALLGRGI